MGKLLVVVALGAVTIVLAVAVLVATVVGAAPASGSANSAGSAGGAGGADAGRQPALPAAWVTVTGAAAATCPGLSWSVLAAIGTVETDNGRSTLPGVASGSNGAGAEGPMQFEPATFAAYDEPVPPGGADPPSPYDVTDAVFAAARLLCADGGADPTTLAGAVTTYNHDPTYVATVLTLAVAYGDDPAVDGAAVGALGFAAAQLGTPYRWGGTGSGGFDCSGLTQAAYAHAGVVLPRVAQDQFDAGPAVPGAPAPGDLVFFGDGPSDVEHVGLYVGDGLMIDAPHTGADVRYDAAAWPDEVGVTDPS